MRPEGAQPAPAARQAGQAARRRPHGHLGHPACLEDGLSMARRSARLWAADDDLQPLQSLVSASCLAAHLREDGGRRPQSRRAFYRQQPRQGPSLGERLKKGEFEEAIGRSRGGRTSKIHALADDRGRPAAFALTQRKRRRRRHGRSASRRRGETKAAAGGQGLRRRQAAPMAKAKEDQSGHSLHRLSAHAIPARSRRRSAPKRHRTPVLHAEQLATRRNPIRPPRSKLSLRPRSHRYHHRVDRIESPT